VRPESLPQWQARLQQAGFRMSELSHSAISFAQGTLGALGVPGSSWGRGPPC